MITKRVWIHTEYYKHIRGVKDKWTREGWFLFGFIPLYIRDTSARG